jgi:hypothetical protein
MRVTHGERFRRYRDDQTILKCELYAHWTLPQLMVDLAIHHNGTTAVVERDYQEYGALLVNNLAPKLVALLFPAGRSFFNSKPGRGLKKAMIARGMDESAINAQFARMETEASLRVFLNAGYSQLIQALRHLIVTGNVLLHRDSKEGNFTAYGLQSYSCRRDGKGQAIDIVLRESTPFESLDQTVKTALRMKDRSRYQEIDGAPAPNVMLFTRICLKTDPSGRKYWEVTQEADDTPVGTTGHYPRHLCPWIALTWNLVAGENYGRGLVEDYAGGFAKMSDGAQAMALYGIEMMKVVNMVSPGAGADIDELANSENGEYVQGNAGEIQAHEAGDAAKFGAMQAWLQATFDNLAKAFMYKGNTRDAERVTAYEIRADALEADTTLGGNYSSLSAQLQVPCAHILMTEVEPDNLGVLVTGDLQLEIIAGIPALGRSIDVQNLVEAATNALAIVPGLMQISRKIDPDRIIDMILTSAGVDTSLIYKSDQQLQEEADAQAQQNNGQQMMMQQAAASDAVETLQNLGE